MASTPPARRLVAGNWKMNLMLDEGLALGETVATEAKGIDFPVVLCAPAIHLPGLASGLAEEHLSTGAQDISRHESGAHTGELSGAQLASAGCAYVLVGHSERRADHGEGGDVLRDKVDQALRAGLRPIYCFGETLEQRDAEQVEAVVADQLAEALSHLEGDAFGKLVLAYEPVWAIGTGRTATPAQAQAVHAFVRSWVEQRFGASRAESVTILYGGSVKPANARELFGQRDIDGGLIGGASLLAGDFMAIVSSYE